MEGLKEDIKNGWKIVKGVKKRNIDGKKEKKMQGEKFRRMERRK